MHKFRKIKIKLLLKFVIAFNFCISLVWSGTIELYTPTNYSGTLVISCPKGLYKLPLIKGASFEITTTTLQDSCNGPYDFYIYPIKNPLPNSKPTTYIQFSVANNGEIVINKDLHPGSDIDNYLSSRKLSDSNQVLTLTIEECIGGYCPAM